MQLFALGYIAGMVTAAFVAAVLIALRKPIYTLERPIVRMLESVGPKPRGFIVEPEDEATRMRNRRIAENAAKGQDTPIAELL